MARRAGTAKTVGQIAVLVVVAAVFAGMLYFAKVDGERDRAREKAARAVNELPAGVEEAWVGYVGRELHRKIARGGDLIRLAPDDIIEQTTFVSPTTPYKVECYPDFVMGAWVNFGQGDDMRMVPVFGASDFKLRGEQPPALGVDDESVAAGRLATRLCRQILAHMESVMATPPR